MLQLALAFLAGILTIGAPCVLPLLPILLGTSIGQSSRTRPLFITLGFVTTFSLASLVLAQIIIRIGLSPNTLRQIAIVLLAVFGGLMLWPKPFELITQRLSGLTTKAQGLSRKVNSPNLSGYILGLTLGLIWTPCAGPVLGSILTLIATQTDLWHATQLILAYALGAGIPMLLIAYGGQIISTRVRVIARYSNKVQKAFGVIILLIAVLMLFNYDTLLQVKLSEYYGFANLEQRVLSVLPGGKSDTSNMTGLNQPIKVMENSGESVQFNNYGPAPEFTGISKWLNSDPVTMASLRGKVVLIDFWTYSCINCIRTLPYVTKWHETYKDKGFTVIGVHTPEFAFEKVTANVQMAIDRYKITYPVAQDNDFMTWSAYKNQFWPAHYLIDQNGNIVYTHFGEGNYDETEKAIQTLLGAKGSTTNGDVSTDSNLPQTPETYFGLARQERFSSPERSVTTPQLYTLPQQLKANQWAVEGTWQFDSERAQLQSKLGKIRLRALGRKVFFVASSDKPVTLKVYVDGELHKAVVVKNSDLYELFNSEDYGDRQIDIEIPQSGLEAFTFTFG